MTLPLRTMILLLAALVLGAGAEAQTPTAELALTGYRVGDDVREYHYVLRNRGLHQFDLVDLYIDVSAPRGDELPPLLEMSGVFLLDAFQVRRDVTDQGRPDLGIGTPDPWTSAIYINGSVSWGAPRFFDHSEGGVAADESLSGFSLRSSAVPALRRYDVDPFYTLRMQNRYLNSEEPGPQWSGWTVAPGWPAELVTMRFVEDQFRAACAAGMLNMVACTRVNQMLPTLIVAERQSRDREYLGGLAQLDGIVQGQALPDEIRDVLVTAVQAARARPPSER